LKLPLPVFHPLKNNNTKTITPFANGKNEKFSNHEIFGPTESLLHVFTELRGFDDLSIFLVSAFGCVYWRGAQWLVRRNA
tara:strand:+ start:405 stop:644 length:240 start_codon:yes stop_codon:yes gene_type:complete